MKKLLFSTFFAAGFTLLNQVVAQNYFSTKIGEVINGIPTVTYDNNSLKQKWQANIASNSTQSLSFNTEVIELIGTAYFLIGTDNASSATASVELVLVGSNLYQKKELQEGVLSGETVLCVGCVTTGCRPNGRRGCTAQCNDECSAIKVKSQLGIVGGS